MPPSCGGRASARKPEIGKCGGRKSVAEAYNGCTREKPARYPLNGQKCTGYLSCDRPCARQIWSRAAFAGSSRWKGPCDTVIGNGMPVNTRLERVARRVLTAPPSGDPSVDLSVHPATKSQMGGSCALRQRPLTRPFSPFAVAVCNGRSTSGAAVPRKWRSLPGRVANDAIALSVHRACRVERHGLQRVKRDRLILAAHWRRAERPGCHSGRQGDDAIQQRRRGEDPAVGLAARVLNALRRVHGVADERNLLFDEAQFAHNDRTAMKPARKSARKPKSRS